MKFKRQFIRLHGKSDNGKKTCSNLGYSWIIVDRERFNKTGNPTGRICIEPALDIPLKSREAKRIWINENNDPDFQVVAS